MIPQLDRDAVASERVDQTLQLTLGCCGAVVDERRADRALAATGEHQPVTRLISQRGERGARRPLLPRQLRMADRAAEPRVAVGSRRQHEQMRALGVGDTVLRRRRPERELGAEHRGHADLASGFREAHHAVEAVVVGQRERVEPEPRGFLRELFGMARTVEEAEVRVAVQLRVRHCVGAPLEGRRRLVGLPPARPCRAVATGVGPRRRARRTAVVAPIRELVLELDPRDLRIAEPHEPRVSNTCSTVQRHHRLLTGGTPQGPE